MTRGQVPPKPRSGPDALKLEELLAKHPRPAPERLMAASQDEKFASIIGPLVKTAMVTLGVWCTAFACVCMWLVTGALLDAAHDVSCLPDQSVQQPTMGVRL